MKLHLVPLKQKVAKEWIREHHRHSGVPVGDVIRVGVASGEELVGVGMAGRPVARGLDDGETLEITRICVLDGYENACSMLYGALCRAGGALGYTRAYTYTLAEESGASVRASNFKMDAMLPGRATWDTPSRERNTEKRPEGPKTRWVRHL